MAGCRASPAEGLHHRRIQRHWPRARRGISPARRGARPRCPSWRHPRGIRRALSLRIPSPSIPPMSATPPRSPMPRRSSVAQHGGADIVIANAGVSRGALTGHGDLDTFRDVMDINYFGMIATFEPFVARMVEERRGTLVGIASVAGIARIAGFGRVQRVEIGGVEVSRSAAGRDAAEGGIGGDDRAGLYPHRDDRAQSVSDALPHGRRCVRREEPPMRLREEGKVCDVSVADARSRRDAACAAAMAVRPLDGEGAEETARGRMIVCVHQKQSPTQTRAGLCCFCSLPAECPTNLKRHVRRISVGVKAEINISSEEERQAEVEQRRE